MHFFLQLPIRRSILTAKGLNWPEVRTIHIMRTKCITICFQIGRLVGFLITIGYSCTWCPPVVDIQLPGAACAWAIEDGGGAAGGLPDRACTGSHPPTTGETEKVGARSQDG